MDRLPLFIAALVGGAWLLHHFSVFNRRGCRSCGGTGKKRSGVFKARYRTCRRCGGKGEVRAFGGRPPT